MGNDKRIKTVNVGNLKTPLENAKDVKVDTSTLAKWKASTQATQKISLDPNKTKANLENAGKINKPSIGAISQNKKNANAKQNGQTCSNFCRKLGLQILPLRYSVAQTKAPQLPTLLGKNVKSVALSYSKYTTEMIDSGYIYAMVKRKKGFQWMGYLVTPMGYLSSFPLDKPAPVTVQEFACKGNEHAFFASFVTVEYIAENLAEKIYIIYTHAPITKAKREEYQGKADEYVSSGKWQRVDVAAWAGGTSQQEHCLNDTTLKLAVNQSSSFGSDRWTKIVAKFAEKPKAYASIALYDPIGITLKLNEYRNEAYAPVDEYLEKKDGNKVSNQRKLGAVQRLDNLKRNLEQTANNSITQNAQSTISRIDYFRTTDGNIIKRIDDDIAQAKREKDFTRVAELEKSKQIKIEDIERKEQAQTHQYGIEKNSRLEKLKADWAICEDKIDFNEAERFKKESAIVFSTALKVADQRAQEHLNWIKSNPLHDALDAYDQKDLQSGCAFKAHVACMLFGMEGATKAAEQLDAWIKKPEYERRNLFIRGLYSNQAEAKTKHDDIIKHAMDFNPAGIKITKVVVDFLKKTDSAWDEWARNQGTNKNKGNIAFSNAEKKIMLYVSNFGRGIFRLGLGSSVESRFIKSLSQKILFAQMGKLAAELEFEKVVHGVAYNANTKEIPFKNVHYNQRVSGLLTAKATSDATIKAVDVLIEDANVKRKEVSLTLTQIINTGSDGMAKNHTNNYHQVRASGILVILEAANLIHMLSSGKYQNDVQIVALISSVTSLIAFTIDIFYGLAKGVRETAGQGGYSAAGQGATREAANIKRAGLKWAGGSLSAATGFMGCWIDSQYYKSFAKEKGGVSQTLSTLYLVRALASFTSGFLGLAATLTYIEPLVNYLQRVGKTPMLQRIGAHIATKEAMRVALLRYVALSSGVGMILTILIELGLMVYTELTKLKKWCETSTFRKLKSNELMSEQVESEKYQALFM